MKLFAFGFGYSVKRLQALFPDFEIIGTCRTAEKVKHCQAQNFQAILFSDHHAVENALKQADAILISAPPIKNHADEFDEPTLIALSRFNR